MLFRSADPYGCSAAAFPSFLKCRPSSFPYAGKPADTDSIAYIICGDNCINKEYGITENQIIGVLVGFYRDGNEVNMEGVGYKLYSRAWVFLHPLICAFKKIKMKAGKVKRLWHSK